MARHNPLGKIKDLTVETLKAPTKVAGKAVGQAKGAAAAGLHVADHVTRSAVTTVGGLVQQRRGGPTTAPVPTEAKAPTKPPVKTAKAPEPEVEVDVKPDEPVNVVEELGLDAAPVETPEEALAREAARSPAPVTEIDAEATSELVDATPADVAKKVAKKAPAKKAAAKKSPPRKKAPAKKTSPSGKLPPRKPADQS